LETNKHESAKFASEAQRVGYEKTASA